MIFTTGDYICETCSQKAGLGIWLSAAEAIIHLDANRDHKLTNVNEERV